MNKDHRQLDVLYIRDMIRSIGRVDVAISVAALQAVVVRRLRDIVQHVTSGHGGTPQRKSQYHGRVSF